MQRITDEHDFWNLTPAAEHIFAYKSEQLSNLASAFGFAHGTLSDDGKSAFAQFSCVALSGYGRDVLTIYARELPSGEWQLSHSIDRDQDRK